MRDVILYRRDIIDNDIASEMLRNRVTNGKGQAKCSRRDVTQQKSLNGNLKKQIRDNTLELREFLNDLRNMGKTTAVSHTYCQNKWDKFDFDVALREVDESEHRSPPRKTAATGIRAPSKGIETGNELKRNVGDQSS